MSRIDKEELRIWSNVIEFFDRAKKDGYKGFTIKGYELIDGDYIDGWAIRIYGETIPLHVHFIYVEHGKGKFKSRDIIVPMPAISFCGQWLEDGGFYFENTFIVETGFRHLILKIKKKVKEVIPLSQGEVPSIYLTGKWLIKHGFWVGFVAKVAVYDDYIIVSSIRNSPRDYNSFIRWQKAHDRRGIEYFPLYYQSLTYEQKEKLSG